MPPSWRPTIGAACSLVLFLPGRRSPSWPPSPGPPRRPLVPPCTRCRCRSTSSTGRPATPPSATTTARVRFAEANRRLTVRPEPARRQAGRGRRDAVLGRASSPRRPTSPAGSTPRVQILLADNPESFLQSAVALNQLGRQQAAILQRRSSRPGRAWRRPATTSPSSAPGPARWPSRSPTQKHAVEAKLAEAKAAARHAEGRPAARSTTRRSTPSAAPRPRVASRSPHRRHPDLQRSGLRPRGGRHQDGVRAARRPLRLRRRRPRLVRLLRPDDVRLDAAGVSLPHSSSAQYSSLRHVVDLRPAAGRPGLLLQPDQPRRHLHRRRPHHPRAAPRPLRRDRAACTRCRSPARRAPKRRCSRRPHDGSGEGRPRPPSMAGCSRTTTRVPRRPTTRGCRQPSPSG